MSAEIINLRRVRKRSERCDREAAADRNRVLHGLTKVERSASRQEAEARNRALDGRRLERAAVPSPDDE